MTPADPPLRLGGPPELTTECVLPALADLVADGLRLEVRLARPDEAVVAALRAGEIDLALCTTRPDLDPAWVTPLPDEKFVLVCAPGWTGRWRQAPLIAANSHLPLLRRYWKTVFATAPPRVAAAVVPDLRGVLRLVEAGAGVTVLPLYLCRSGLEAGTLVDPVQPELVPGNALFLAGPPPDGDRKWTQQVRARIATFAPGW